MFEPFVTVIFNFGEVCCFTNLEKTFIFTNIALREVVYIMTYIHLYPTSLIYSGNRGLNLKRSKKILVSRFCAEHTTGMLICITYKDRADLQGPFFWIF